MKAYVFPGQGAQFTGMGHELYEQNPKAKELMDRADAVLGFKLTDIMFSGSEDDTSRRRSPSRPCSCIASFWRSRIRSSRPT